MNRVIVIDDDLGYSRGVNLGIADAVNQGIITSVGVMTNMPETYSGLKLIEKANPCLGLHTNICVGRPLSDPALIPSIVQENGEFKSSKTYRSSKEDFVVLHEVILEIEAQYRRFVELTGRKPRYFEGHALESENFNKALEIVAQLHGCDFLPFNPKGSVPFRNSRAALEMDSTNPDYDPVQFLKDLAAKKYNDGAVPVMVCHPGYLDAYILRTSSLTIPRVKEVEMACSQEVKKWLQENKVEIISFDDLA